MGARGGDGGSRKGPEESGNACWQEWRMTKVQLTRLLKSSIEVGTGTEGEMVRDKNRERLGSRA